MTLFVAERKINDFMKGFDMRPDFKWFVTIQKVSFETTTAVNGDYFKRIIEKSKSNPDMWIPAIKYMDNMFTDPGVKVISDGQKEMFI